MKTYTFTLQADNGPHKLSINAKSLLEAMDTLYKNEDGPESMISNIAIKPYKFARK